MMSRQSVSSLCSDLSTNKSLNLTKPYRGSVLKFTIIFIANLCEPGNFEKWNYEFITRMGSVDWWTHRKYQPLH